MVRSPYNVALQTVDATKSANAILDYSIDWAALVGASEDITSSNWVASSTDITIVSNTISGTTTDVFISGGRNGYFYDLENTITTSEGRTFIRLFSIGVQPK
tara:strand:+ start:3331 stop:3636 length:306 start_codon:yes stop_codon:yes gene_type:complete